MSASTASWLLLGFGVVWLIAVANAYRPLRRPPLLAGASFFAGWLTAELAMHHLIAQAAISALLVWLGALSAWPGQAGLVLGVLSWLGLVKLQLDARDVRGAARAALREAFGDPAEPAPAAFRRRDVMVPFPVTHPEVERVKNVVFSTESGRPLRLDVWRHRSPPQKAPVLVFVHGGGWVIGSKDQQGLPLVQHLAARGWVCFSVSYRLSPRATFPDHLVNVKRALAWVREHAAEYGGDPAFMAIAGNSAGAHLASLAALTHDEHEWQPGFETADTRVAACVALYGVYDLLDRHGHWPHRGLRGVLERLVFKAKISERREVFERASPLARVRADAPPFFVVHGDRDTMVPVEEGRRFSQALRAVSHEIVAYAEIPGGQHAFEVFRSVRALETIAAAGDFLESIRRRAPVLVESR